MRDVLFNVDSFNLRSKSALFLQFYFFELLFLNPLSLYVLFPLIGSFNDFFLFITSISLL